MALPPDLDWSDRLAPYTHPYKGPGFYFLCQRDGHRDRKRKHVQFLPGKKTDAKEFRDAHDVAHHNAQFRDLGFHPEKNMLIEDACRQYLRHVERLEVDGLQDSQTTRHYAYMINSFIRPGFAAQRVKTIREVGPMEISEFVRWARENTKSKGAAIADAISAFKTIIRQFGFGSLADDIKVPLKEIRPQRFEKRDLDTTTIRRLVTAMPDGSLEEAMSYLKAGTGARDIEIYRATAAEFEFDVEIDTDDGASVLVGVWEPVLRAKGSSSVKERRHVYALTPDIVAKVRPWVRAAALGEPVFRDDECRGVDSKDMREKMRPRIRAASKLAGIVTTKKNSRWIGRGGKGKKDYENVVGEIDSIAPIRHEVVTLVKENISLAAASEQAGHVDESTTRKWYVKDRRTKNQLLSRYRSAAILHRELPLTTTVN